MILCNESLQRRILRRLQCLPNNTANVAVYCLLGADKSNKKLITKKTSLLASILYSENTIEFELACRQMAIKGNDSNSWFIHCNHLLPNIYNLKQSTNSKETLKAEIKHKIDDYVHQSWEEGSSKSSLSYLNLHDCSIGEVHQCLKSVDHNTRDVRRALIKVKILMGVYVLQYNRARFNQHAVSTTCCLCRAAVEDRVHFVLGCSGLDPVRQNYLKRIHSLLTSLDKKIADMIMTDQKLLMQLLTNSSNIEELNTLNVDDSIYKE